MDMQATTKVGHGKAVVALSVGLSVLLIYNLACILSPVAWSPDSSKIALLVTPPGDDFEIFAIFTYDVTIGEHILLDKVTGEGGALSAPAWSPDGNWIAYYKVDPCDATPMAAQIEDYSEETPVDTVQDQKKPTVSGEQPFSEDDESCATLNVKLMIVTPDGNEQEVLQVVSWANNGDVLEELMLSRLVWSADSSRIFYALHLSESPEFEICSLYLNTGEVQTHVASSTGAFAVSPDGNWIATLGKDGEDSKAIALTELYGNTSQYLPINYKDNQDSIGNVEILWSANSRKVFIQAEETAFYAVDFTNKNMELYTDHAAESIAYPVLSLLDDKLYYLAGCKGNDVNSPEDIIDLKCMNLEDGQIETIFTVSEIPELDGAGRFDISPNGKMVLLRCVMDPEIGDDKSAFVLWDGQKRKIIETDRWLIEPIYTDEELIFEEKLTGQWMGIDGVVLDLIQMEEEMAYDVIAVDEDDEERQYFAHLVNLEGMMFLGMFRDKSLLQQKDSQGFHVVPDVFWKVEQIEPNLLLQELGYEEVSEMLKRGPSLKQGAAETNYVFDGVRL